MNDAILLVASLALQKDAAQKAGTPEGQLYDVENALTQSDSHYETHKPLVVFASSAIEIFSSSQATSTAIGVAVANCF